MQEAFGRLPTDAGVSDGDAVAEFRRVFREGLVALVHDEVVNVLDDDWVEDC
jgi:hypothetical protein